MLLCMPIYYVCLYFFSIIFYYEYVINVYLYIYIKTHFGLVTPYGDIDLGNIGSINGLMPDGTKSLPGTMITNHQ